MHRTTNRLLLAATLALGGTFALAGPAAAHVTVQPGTATQGGYTAVAFRVPNERDAANTTKLQVTFPEEQPLAGARVKPHPGWTYQIAMRKLATPIEVHGRQITDVVQAITWTAATPATAIKPTEFDEFEVSMGPLPEADQMVFKAVQTYSNGEAVHWIEEAAEGAEEPEHPAPVLELLPADQEDDEAAAGTREAIQITGTGDGDTDATAATWLAAGALALSLAATVVAVLALRRRPTT